eukprot:GHVQ01004635.1.p1 GENE.GHVQ01004635.1~~GHVQ01004635.1.p1  ORF type:complete len:446 (-),score=69.26 GHVQ01004635.1:525-1700(-)
MSESGGGTDDAGGRGGKYDSVNGEEGVERDKSERWKNTGGREHMVGCEEVVKKRGVDDEAECEGRREERGCAPATPSSPSANPECGERGRGQRESDGGEEGGGMSGNSPMCQGGLADDGSTMRPSTLAKNMSKVRSTLRQFVRDWSDEGAEERTTAYGPLLEALEANLPILDPENPPRVLCPGSGLGRLPFEVVKRGYTSQGNEFSYFMLLGSNFVLNYSLKPNMFPIQPYCLASSNRKLHNDHLRTVHIPDTCPGDWIPPHRDFSMCAGEFVEVYRSQVKEWDAVLTCFFIDTAKNVLRYIETIAAIIRPEGIWVNIGPLLYHYAEVYSEMSIELSWEELRTLIERYFKLTKVEWRESFYTTNDRSMMQVLYHCIFFCSGSERRGSTRGY